jgi:hypothetical protein
MTWQTDNQVIILLRKYKQNYIILTSNFHAIHQLKIEIVLLKRRGVCW